MSELETVKNDETEQVVVEQPARKKPGPKSKAEKEAEAAAKAAAEAEVAEAEASMETAEAEVVEAEGTLNEDVESSDTFEVAPVVVSDDTVVNGSDETAAEVETEIADDNSIANSESVEASIDNTNEEVATNNFKGYTLKSRGNIPLQMSPGIHSIAYYPSEIQIKSAPNENGYSKASAFIPGVGFKEGYVKL